MLFSTTLKVKYVRGALCLGPTDRQQQSLLFSSTLPTDRSLIVLQHFLTSEEFLLQEICFTREGTKPSYSQRPPPSTLHPPGNICPVIRCTLFPLNPLAISCVNIFKASDAAQTGHLQPDLETFRLLAVE